MRRKDIMLDYRCQRIGYLQTLEASAVGNQIKDIDDICLVSYFVAGMRLGRARPLPRP
jgi:hypothetical protein